MIDDPRPERRTDPDGDESSNGGYWGRLVHERPRRRDIFHSRPFRMAGLYASVFAALSAIMLSIMLALYMREVRLLNQEVLNRQVAELYQLYRETGTAELEDYARRLRNQPGGSRWSMMIEVNGDRLFVPSNLSELPEPDRDGALRRVQLDRHAAVTLYLNNHEWRESIRLMGKVLTTGIATLIVLALTGGVLIAWLTNLRISRMDRALAATMQGDLRSRLPVSHRGDELDRLASNVNLALDRVQQLMATVKSATDGIAHDLRTPLARHRARLESALCSPPRADELLPWLEQGLNEIDRILATFRGLMQLATVEAGSLRAHFTTVDLATVAADLVELYDAVAAERGIQIHSNIGPAEVSGLRDLLGQSIANLLDNAIKFAPDHSRVSLGLRASQKTVRIIVSDHGPGIPESEREHVFRRLYRLDSSRSTPGIGLGLSLVKAVVDLHDGNITLKDNHPGLRVVINLPLEAAQAAQ